MSAAADLAIPFRRDLQHNLEDHLYCLEKCKVRRLPKRTEDFVCPHCQYPEVLQWKHPGYTNTCTSDNIITIILTYCRQNTNFLSYLKTSAAENILKSGLMTMLNGNLAQGKSIILDWVKSQLNLPLASDGTCNCYGTEREQFMCLFRHVWKLHQSRKCDSKFCPSQTSDRFVSTFALTEAFECNVSYDYQIERKFPLSGVSLEGYCGEKFASIPPLSAPQALNSKYNVDNNTTEHFIECRGTPQVISSSFLSGVPTLHFIN